MKVAQVNAPPFPKLTSVSGIGGATAIPSMEDLTDVDVTGIVDGDALVWDAGTSTWIPGSASVSGATTATDHEHVDNVMFSGDGSTTVFELPAAPFDAYAVGVYVAGVRLDVALSGALLTTMTFGSAPAAGTNNIVVDIVAAVA